MSFNVIMQRCDCWLLVYYDTFIVYGYSEKRFHCSFAVYMSISI